VVSWTTYWFFSSWIAVALIFSQLALGGMWGTANKFRVTSLPENFRGTGVSRALALLDTYCFYASSLSVPPLPVPFRRSREQSLRRIDRNELSVQTVQTKFFRRIFAVLLFYILNENLYECNIDCQIINPMFSLLFLNKVPGEQFYVTCYNSVRTRPTTRLGHQVGRRGFWKGPKFLNYVQ